MFEKPSEKAKLLKSSNSSWLNVLMTFWTVLGILLFFCKVVQLVTQSFQFQCTVLWLLTSLVNTLFVFTINIGVNLGMHNQLLLLF